MQIDGLHHITLVCADAQRTVDFYTQVLGLRLVKQTVNFDDPGSYHLYFGDDLGRPGSVITFFEWPGAARGYPGIGGTDHLALAVADYTGLLKWKRRLTDYGLPVQGPLGGHPCSALYFNDPDGTILEIAMRPPDRPAVAAPFGAGSSPPPADLRAYHCAAARIAAETWPEPVPEITPAMALRHGLHHITILSSDMARTAAFYGDLLGLHRAPLPAAADDPASAHWQWSVGAGGPAMLVTCCERDPTPARRARLGAGQTHHFALAVSDEATQLAWRARLVAAGLRVSAVMDRVYFKSIYTNDPDGHIVELATAGPGFHVDEAAADLGRRLQLPAWLEGSRSSIAARLAPLRVPALCSLAPVRS